MATKGITKYSDAEVIAQLKKYFSKSIGEVKSLKSGVIYAELSKRDSILKVSKYLKYKLNFAYPLSISALDWPENYEVVYHLVSYENNNLIELHVKLPKDDPEIMSVVRVWKGANSHEREAYDLMGIIFKTHPDLRRILLPDDVDYHPLRKDFPLGGKGDKTAAELSKIDPEAP